MRLSVRSSCGWWFVASGFWLTIPVQVVSAEFLRVKDFSANLSSGRGEAVSGQEKTVSNTGVLAKPACSSLEVESLTANLLRDLPSYANRVTQRSRRLRRQNDLYSYMVIAGNPDFNPLPIAPTASTTESPSATPDDVKQVFFTTLERQYLGKRVIQIQQFHWLFLTKTEQGWQLVFMFTQTGTFPTKQPPTPPRDSSNSAVAQAVKIWLRDCQAGSVRTMSNQQ